MKETWRIMPELLKMLPGIRFTYETRDPFAVCIIEFAYLDKTYRGYGFTKRCRYAKSLDENNPDRAKHICIARAYKDIYDRYPELIKNLANDHKAYLEAIKST